MPKAQTIRTKCLQCHCETKRNRYKYCSNQCQADYQYAQYIDAWLRGEKDGLQRLGIVSRHVKRFLREKYANKCCLCSWAEVNIITGVVPLVADHIDGNWQNNTVDNLRLICPNCDALTATYAALNKGRGRRDRPPSRRYEAGRLLKQAGVTQLVE